jgi:hypothetical protein
MCVVFNGTLLSHIWCRCDINQMFSSIGKVWRIENVTDQGHSLLIALSTFVYRIQ